MDLTRSATRGRLPRFHTVLVALAVVLMLLAGGVHADKPGSGKGNSGKSSGKGGVSADEAAAQVQRKHGGRVLSAQPMNSDSGAVRVKVLTNDGHVKVIVVQPNR
jgi:hypothetical protein